MKANLYIGLVHYPVYNKHGEVITTAITNYDVHDIARAAVTYDVTKYFIIHNVPSQRALVEKMMDHWKTGYGSKYNPDRKDAFHVVSLQDSVQSTLATIEAIEGKKPIVATTDARVYPNTVSYSKMRETIAEQDRPVVILFGTGYGMTKEMMSSFDVILEPVYGHSVYNHLSVRSAVSIILDRLRGTEWWINK